MERSLDGAKGLIYIVQGLPEESRDGRATITGMAVGCDEYVAVIFFFH